MWWIDRLFLLGIIVGVVVSFTYPDSSHLLIGFALVYGAIGLFVGMVIGLIQYKALQDSVIKTATDKRDHDNRIESTHVISEATSSKADGTNTRERMMQTKRYWGIVLYSACLALLSLILAGGGPPSVHAVLWLFAGYYAFKGNLEKLLSLAKFMVVLVVLVGVVVFFWLNHDPEVQIYVGKQTGLIVGFGWPLLTWLIMWGWASSQRHDAVREGEDVCSAHKASPIVQQESALETGIPIELKGQPDREAMQAATSVAQFEAGQILLEYDDQVRSAFASLNGLPQEIKDRFLMEVAANPKANTKDVRNMVLLHALGRPDLSWDQEIEDLIQNCKGANPDDVRELFRVFSILSKRMSPAKVFKKVVGGDNEEFEVVKAGSRTTTVIRRPDGRFLVELSFGRRIFSSDQEVYEYLGTPQNKRNSLPRS